jgi:hypothetical protein
VAVGKWALVIVVLGGMTVDVDQGGSQLPPVESVLTEERLWTALIANGASNPDPAEAKLLTRACGTAPLEIGSAYDSWKACRAKNLKPLRHRIAALHAAPNESSPILARVFEERVLESDNEVGFRWALELASAPGAPVPWPDASKAFDYGLHLAGVQRRGNWVRLLSSIPADGWLRINTEPDVRGDERLYIYVEPLGGKILDLEPLMAQWPDGRRRQTTSGSYLIQKVAGGTVEFREEIPSDFSCGETVSDPKPLPPRLRAPASEFFNRDETPRFSTKYTKGC